jgi:hypothetical protein
MVDTTSGSLRRGGTWQLDLTLWDLDGGRLNLAGAEIEYRVSSLDLRRLVLSATILSGEVEVVDASSGLARVTVAAAVTTDIPAGQYRHEVFVKTADDFSDPIIDGILTVLDSLKARFGT